MEPLTNLFYWLCVALGIGFVIFVHELGHFALAKWNGVKVERFSIGFGPALLKFKRGETEYILAALPLGGYVQMLGESQEEGAETPQDDPRAYVNKSVGARMSIISAGVVMNLILGLACFSLIYARGLDEIPTSVGEVSTGSPAYEAGLRPGDDIVSIDGRLGMNFNQMKFKVVLSGAGQKLDFRVKRPGVEKEIPITIEPRRDPKVSAPTIGVLPDHSLLLVPTTPFRSFPGMAKPEGPEGGFKGWDKVVAIGPVGSEPTGITNSVDYRKLLAAHRDKPLVVVVERTLPEGAKPDLRTPPKGPARTLKYTVSPHPFHDFGMVMTAGPISSIQDNSPAKAAGLAAGDRIVSIDGNADYDPMTVPDLIYARAGSLVKLEVERDGAKRTVEITPNNSPIWVEAPPTPANPKVDGLKIPGLGLAIRVIPKIRSIVPDSPTARAGLQPGQTIKSITLTPPRPDPDADAPDGPEPKKATFTFGDDGLSWSTVITSLQFMKPASIELAVDGKAESIAIQTAAVPGRFHGLRGLEFEFISRYLPPQDFASSISRGWEDTVENVVGIYLMIRGLFQRRVSTENVGGIFRTAGLAYNQASAGLSPFLGFLGMLSINLAVLNFLPIPPLDGGQMVFLIGEKVRGRPLPDWFIRGMLVMGLVFVISLMLFANIQDIWIKIKEYFF